MDAFYFDLASPLAYLAAERVLHELPGPLQWQPVLARELGDAQARDAQARDAQARDAQARDALVGARTHDASTDEAPACPARTEIERRARELGLQPLRWPQPFPFDSEPAMLAATYAKRIGRVVPFAQAAFRQAFAGGHDLGQVDVVLIAAAACEMHPQAVSRALELRSVQAELVAATRAATAAGVRAVPAVLIGGRVFCGPDALRDARGWASRDGENSRSKKAKRDLRERADAELKIRSRASPGGAP